MIIFFISLYHLWLYSTAAASRDCRATLFRIINPVCTFKSSVRVIHLPFCNYFLSYFLIVSGGSLSMCDFKANTIPFLWSTRHASLFSLSLWNAAQDDYLIHDLLILRSFVACFLFVSSVTHSRLLMELFSLFPSIWFTCGRLHGFSIKAIATNIFPHRLYSIFVISWNDSRATSISV